MAFRLGNGIWGNVFAVPSEITDKHLKIASGLSVKVLLLLLRSGGDMEPAAMAAALAQSTADIQDALNYWVQSGVIHTDDPVGHVEAESPAENVRSLTPALHYQEFSQPSPDNRALAEAPADKASDSAGERKVATISASRRRLTTQMINEMAQQDENIAYLLQEAQSALGKTLTPVATDTVVALYSYLGMQPDLILMLMHYCVSVGKNSMHYIEKVAANWLERGIDTHEKAEEEILRLTHRNTAEGRIKSAFGIDRNLVPAEKKYIHTWMEEYGLDMDLIVLAYERAVELKGKLSFPYINGILTNWHTKGIRTPAQAMQESRGGKKSGKADPNAKERSYDMDELENMITYGDVL